MTSRFVNLGNALLGQNKYADAIATYSKAIVLDKTDADAYTNLGVALRRKQPHAFFAF